ncbi:MAG: HK97 gp10 family phage protein [Parabacteroides sp.]|nr:HK97 gp10 family phage protein [Parabacteroides sp.]
MSELADTLTKALIDYGEQVDKLVDEKAKATMKELVSNTKKDAPVNSLSDGEHYRDQISSKTLKSGSHSKSYLWYVNGDKYRLAHLLNNGHALRNGGRIPGDNHITRNAQVAIDNYEREVKEAIQNGS